MSNMDSEGLRRRGPAPQDVVHLYPYFAKKGTSYKSGGGQSGITIVKKIVLGITLAAGAALAMYYWYSTRALPKYQQQGRLGIADPNSYARPGE